MHSAFISGVAPFLVALVLIYALARYIPDFSGMGILSGSWVSAMLLISYGNRLPQSIWIILSLGLAGLGVGAMVERLSPHLHIRIAIMWAAGFAAAAFIVGPLLPETSASIAILITIMATLYTGWIVWGLTELRNRPISAYSALAFLGVGSGIAALFGDALFAGHVAMGSGFAAVAGLAVMFTFKWDLKAGYLVTVPMGLTLGLLGVDALVHARLSPLSLVALALIPLYVHFLIEDRMRTVLGFLKRAVVSLLIVALAVYLADKGLG